jgi:MoaA/NifB/PqqE/SkfB family radical SAM enzyme
VNYQIEADWQLLNTCNYRCNYCFFSSEVLGEKLKTYADADEWSKAFETSGLRWLLHLTGGEPSLYPNFVGLCEQLTQQHFISINSNMTNRSWEGFAERVDPGRVSFINGGLHLEEREQRRGNEVFLKSVELLMQCGFQVFVSLVGTPKALARFDEAVRLLAPIGMFPVPKILRGPFEGKVYPSAYTVIERYLFRKYADMARKFCEPILAKRTERLTIDMFRDDSIIYGEPSYKGLSCEAGRLFVRIDPKGEIFRCGTSESLGNIREGTFVRAANPAPCDTSYCFYFCQKYSHGEPKRAKAYGPFYRSLRQYGKRALRMRPSGKSIG